jgi:hypothetical protein
MNENVIEISYCIDFTCPLLSWCKMSPAPEHFNKTINPRPFRGKNNIPISFPNLHAVGQTYS